MIGPSASSVVEARRRSLARGPKLGDLSVRAGVRGGGRKGSRALGVLGERASERVRGDGVAPSLRILHTTSSPACPPFGGSLPSLSLGELGLAREGKLGFGEEREKCGNCQAAARPASHPKGPKLQTEIAGETLYGLARPIAMGPALGLRGLHPKPGLRSHT